MWTFTKRKAAARCSHDHLTFTRKAVARRSCSIVPYQIQSHVQLFADDTAMYLVVHDFYQSYSSAFLKVLPFLSYC